MGSFKVNKITDFFTNIPCESLVFTNQKQAQRESSEWISHEHPGVIRANVPGQKLRAGPRSLRKASTYYADRPREFRCTMLPARSLNFLLIVFKFPVNFLFMIC